MTLVWRCPHCKTQYHGTNHYFMGKHKLKCWPEDSPFWNDGEPESLREQYEDWELDASIDFPGGTDG